MMTRQQNALLHKLLGELGELDEKSTWVQSASLGRTSRSSELSAQEASALITDLKREVDKQRKPHVARITAILYKIANNYIKGWLQADGKLNYAMALKLGFKAGATNLNGYTLAELPRLRDQYRAILRNYESKHNTKGRG